MFSHQLDLTTINPSQLTTNQEFKITDILKDLIQKKNVEGLNLFVKELEEHGFNKQLRTQFGITSKRTVLQELFLKCNTYHNLCAEAIKANIFLDYKKILKSLIGNDAMENFIYISGSSHLNPKTTESKEVISPKEIRASLTQEAQPNLVRPIPIRLFAAQRSYEETLIPENLFDSNDDDKIRRQHSPA